MGHMRLQPDLQIGQRGHKRQPSAHARRAKRPTKVAEPQYKPHPFGVYRDKVSGELTDPPHPKLQAVAKGSVLHRLKDGAALCGSRRAHWYAYPDEQPTCEQCKQTESCDSVP